jgi:hypothetical protein
VLHERIEPARRLVEDEQVRVREEGAEDADLAPVATRQVSDGPVKVELEPIRQLGQPVTLEPPPQPADRDEELPSGRRSSPGT